MTQLLLWGLLGRITCKSSFDFDTQFLRFRLEWGNQKSALGNASWMLEESTARNPAIQPGTGSTTKPGGAALRRTPGYLGPTYESRPQPGFTPGEPRFGNYRANQIIDSAPSGFTPVDRWFDNLSRCNVK